MQLLPSEQAAYRDRDIRGVKTGRNVKCKIKFTTRSEDRSLAVSPGGKDRPGFLAAISGRDPRRPAPKNQALGQVCGDARPL